MLDRRVEGPHASPALPTFDRRGAFVSVDDRDALYQAMDGRWLPAVIRRPAAWLRARR